MLNENKSIFANMWTKPAIITASLLAVMIVPSFFLAENLVATLTKVAIMALFATSLNLQLGYGDLPALGQVMYFGMGAYVFTWLTTKSGLSIFPAFLATMGGMLLISMFIGFICLRSGTLFGFIFLNNGISLLIWSFVNKAMWIGADGGLLNTPRPAFAQSTVEFHIFTVIVITVCIIILYLIRLSPFTNMLKGSRENDQRLLFLGVSVRTVRWVTHILSALFTVIAGVLFSMRNYGAYPTYLVGLLSTEMVIACVVGGFYNFMGPILGAAIVTIINTSISNETIYYQLILGIIIMISVFFLKKGFLPGPESKKYSQSKTAREVKAAIEGGKGAAK